MSDKAKAAVEEAKKLLGTPVKWGGSNPSGFDCAGLVQYCYRQVGVDLPRTSSEQINIGEPITQTNLEIGDLVFPKPLKVGLYIGNGKFIHANKVGDVVKISNISSFYAGRRVA